MTQFFRAITEISEMNLGNNIKNMLWISTKCRLKWRLLSVSFDFCGGRFVLCFYSRKQITSFSRLPILNRFLIMSLKHQPIS